MEKLKLAVQSKGRLREESLEILKKCGIRVNNREDTLVAEAKNFPLEVLYLRNSDMPKYVEQGVADIAICGENTIIENAAEVHKNLELDFAYCRLSLAVAKDVDYKDISYFQGKTIATSYPNTVKNFLKQKGVEADIHVIAGSVEIAPNIGLADGICDLVSTGSTLLKNGLKEVEVLLRSQAQLVSKMNLSQAKQNLIDQLVFRLKSVLNAKGNQYVLLNAPNEKIDTISDLLPGMRSPTVLPLAQEGWSSVHSVINETDFWEKIDELRNAGAEGILIIPIEKMIL